MLKLLPGKQQFVCLKKFTFSFVFHLPIDTGLKATRAKWSAMKKKSTKNSIPKVARSQATSKLWDVHPTVIRDTEQGI